MKRPLLHIGFHKTGTTFLQQQIFGPAGKGYAAVWTVASGEAVEYFVLDTAAKFDPSHVRSSFYEAYEPVVGDAVPVVSHEDLCGYPFSGRYYGYETARRLHSVFPDGRVLIGVREQKLAIRSLYGEYVRQEGVLALRDLIDIGGDRTGFRPLLNPAHLEFDLLADFYCELFGSENVLVAPLELLQSDPVRYTARLHAFSGADSNVDSVSPPSRVGRRALTVEFERVLNRFIRKPPNWYGAYEELPLAVRGKERMLRMMDKALPIRWHAARAREVSRTIEAVVGDRYKRSNRRLAEIADLPLQDYGYDL